MIERLVSAAGVGLHQPRHGNILKLTSFPKRQASREELDALVRDTLIIVARHLLSLVAFNSSSSQKPPALADVLAAEFTNPKKCKLAISFLRWCEKNRTSELSLDEVSFYKDLFEEVNKTLNS
jgi:hypothetical protein